MKIAKMTLWGLLALLLTSCGRQDGGGASGATNLSIVVWSTFPAVPSSYHHIEHLQQLQKKANALITTNQAIFSQSQAKGKLPNDSPLRGLLGISSNEPAQVSWSQTIDHRYITIRSDNTAQRFGRIKVNLRTGLIDSIYDVESLFVISEMERRLRRIVGTREEALRLFSGKSLNSPSLEQNQARKAICTALLLPQDSKLEVRMSAPGGSNRGYGYLSISDLSTNYSSVARVGYPPSDTLLSAFGVTRPSYRFGGLSLSGAWTNLNTQGFLIDGEGCPYPKGP